MFIMACYERNADDVDVAVGKKGHSVTVTTKEKIEVNREAEENQVEGGKDESSDEDDSGSDDDSEGDGSDESSDKSGDKDSGSEEDSDDESDESEEEATAKHLPKSKVDDEGDANQVIFRAKSERVTPKFQSLARP